MKAMKYLLKLPKHELGVVINALNLEFQKQERSNAVDTRTADLLLRLLDVYAAIK